MLNRMVGLLLVFSLVVMLEGKMLCGSERCKCSPEAGMISCEGMGLKRIPIFTEEEMMDMDTLLISGNNIKAITEDDYRGLTGFQIVDLRNNPIICANLRDEMDGTMLLTDCDYPATKGPSPPTFEDTTPPTDGIPKDESDDAGEQDVSVTLVISICGFTITIVCSAVFGIVNFRIVHYLRNIYRTLNPVQDGFEPPQPPAQQGIFFEMEEGIGARVRRRREVQRRRRRCVIN